MNEIKRDGLNFLSGGIGTFGSFASCIGLLEDVLLVVYPQSHNETLLHSFIASGLIGIGILGWVGSQGIDNRLRADRGLPKKNPFNLIPDYWNPRIRYSQKYKR